LVQSQVQISEIEQSAKIAIQSSKEQNDEKFTQSTEVDVGEQRYREQVAIECKQRQDLVDQRLADSDNQIATILQQAREREAQIRFEAEDTIRKQHLEFEKMKDHAIVQFNQIESQVVGDASDEMRKHVQTIEQAARAEIADLKEKFMFREQNLESQIAVQAQTLSGWQIDIRTWQNEKRDLTSTLSAQQEAHQIQATRAQS